MLVLAIVAGVLAMVGLSAAGASFAKVCPASVLVIPGTSLDGLDGGPEPNWRGLAVVASRLWSSVSWARSPDLAGVGGRSRRPVRSCSGQRRLHHLAARAPPPSSSKKATARMTGDMSDNDLDLLIHVPTRMKIVATSR